MPRKSIINALLLCFLLFASSSTAYAYQKEELQKQIDNTLWITEHYPPFHYQQDGQIRGIGIEILSEIFKRNSLDVDLSNKILVFPWARAVKELSKNPDALVISMAITEERAQLYKLTKPLFYERISLIALSSSQIALDDIENVANYSIGAVRDDIGERLIKDLTEGELHITYVQTSNELLQMLLKKRIDIIAYSADIVNYQISRLGLPRKDFKVVRILQELPVSIAFNRNHSGHLYRFLNENIDILREDDTIGNILKRYRH